MSTKTSFKRVALVAVAALGMGVLTSVSPASAGVGAAQTATISPIRVTFTGAATSADAVPAGTISFTNNSGATIDTATATATLTVTSAPSAASEVNIQLTGGGLVKDTLAAGGTALTSGNAFSAGTTSPVSGATITGAISLTAANAAAGTYAGTLAIGDGTDTISVNWSFTTVGAPKSIKLSKTTAGFPAIVTADGAEMTGEETVEVSLLDAAGKVTQPATGDTIKVSVADYTNIALSAATTEAHVDLTLTATDLGNTGKKAIYLGSRTATADSEVVTFTPQGVLPGLGVTSVTLTAASAATGTGTGVVTSVVAPTAVSVIAAGATATAKKVDTSVTSFGFNVTGWAAGSAYRIGVYAAEASGSNLTATINDTTGDLIETLTGIATTSPVAITVVLANQAANDTISIDGNGDGDFTDTSDMVITLTAATYSNTSSSTVTPILLKAGTPIVVSGKFADTYGNPVSGATVSVTTTMTPSTETALTGSATTAADGTYSVTLTPTATTTVVVFTATATKTGITGSFAGTVTTVNFNASGNPGTLTYADSVSDQDTAATATTLPASRVPYAGTLAGNSNEVYTIATAANDADVDPTDVCVALTPSTDVGAQVVVTGSAGVKFTTTTCAGEALSTLVSTVTVASGTAIYAVSTKTGENTVTFTSGNLTKTAKFVATNVGDGGVTGDAIRNIVPVSSTITAAAGEITYITLQATDVFGNAVKSATSGTVPAFPGTITAKASGQVLLDGPALSRTYNTTDADGNIIIGIIASGKAGTGSVAITSVAGSSGQLGAAAGAVTGTTAGTITEFAASKSTATVSVTVSGGAADVAALTTLVNSLLKKINAMQSLLNKIQKKLGVK